MSASLDFVAHHAQTRPTKLACVDLETSKALSYAALDSRANQTASLVEAVFAARGRKANGERLAVLARNSSDVVCLYLACTRIGAIFQPLNWRLAPAELACLARDGDPGVLVFDPEFEAGAAEIAQACPDIMLIARNHGAEGFERRLAAAPPPHRWPQRRDDEPTTLLYTSGTTGKAKGVIVSEANAHTTALNYADAAHVDGDSVFLCDMPMFHVVGLFAVTRTTLQMGATLLISPRFDADETVRRIADEKLGITHFFCVPQMAQMLRLSMLFDPAPFRRLVALQTGGAPLAEASARAWVDDGVTLIDGYGMSEAGTVLGMPPGDLDLLRSKAGAAGLPAIHVEVRLVDRDGRDVAPGEIGEIWLRGLSVTKGYWRNEDATRTAFHDGWLKTGDAARRDADGFYTLVDRWKDMFISGGENVYPAEVEAALLELKGVAEAAVFGAPDPRWGESGVAFVVCAPGARAESEEIIGHCRRRLAAYKAPKHVRIVASLPRTASGKVQKNELRKAWLEEMKS